VIKKLINPKTTRYVNLKNLIISSKFSWTWLNQTTPKQNKDGYETLVFMYIHSLIDQHL